MCFNGLVNNELTFSVKKIRWFLIAKGEGQERGVGRKSNKVEFRFVQFHISHTILDFHRCRHNANKYFTSYQGIDINST